MECLQLIANVLEGCLEVQKVLKVYNSNQIIYKDCDI